MKTVCPLFCACCCLPADFVRIPAGSDKDEVLASVTGADAAEEARIDADIPQTAKVKRKTAAITAGAAAR